MNWDALGAIAPLLSASTMSTARVSISNRLALSF